MGTTGGTSWAAFGFLWNSPGTGAIHTGATTGGVVWALTRNDSVNPDQVLHENVAGGTGLIASGDYVTGATSVNMPLVFDTTGGIGIAKCNSLSPHAFRSFALCSQ